MVYLKVLTVASAAAFASWMAYSNKANDNVYGQLELKEELLKLNKPVNIAIIGTGIGGSSAAFFLRKMFGDQISIDMYEKSNRIGGRMKTIEYAGHYMESGASIIHDSNKYMVLFTQHLGLERMKAMDDSKLGIWNGNEFVFQSSSSKIISNIQLLWRYGFFSLWNLDRSIANMLEKFSNIYTLQNDGKSFKSPVELVRAQGGEEFVNCTQRKAEDVMRENGISQLLIDELVTGVTRCNYGQDANVNAFTGYVSMAGTGGSLFSVKGGNQQVCEGLIKHAQCNVILNRKVLNINKKIIENNKILYNIETDNNKDSKDYDAIIVAAPLEVPSSYFQCSKCDAWPDTKSGAHYQRTVATFVQGKMNPRYFDKESDNDTPDAVFTTENKTLPFSSLGTQKTIEGVIIKPPVYKVFSRDIPSNETLKEIFTESKIKPLVVDWLAYPHYTPPEHFTPFVLDKGVFYVNSIERAASAMEMSAIGGRNAALLTKDYLLNAP